jgi:hypothetical protein
MTEMDFRTEMGYSSEAIKQRRSDDYAIFCISVLDEALLTPIQWFWLITYLKGMPNRFSSVVSTVL